MRITVKQINELIAPNGFSVVKEKNQYMLKKGGKKFHHIKGSLKANYDKILGLAGVSAPVQQELIKKDFSINDDVKQLFHYAYDILWGDYKNDIKGANLIRFKTTDLNGITSKINYNQNWSGIPTGGETLFNLVWKGIIRFQFQNLSDCEYKELADRFEKEMDIKTLIKG